MLSTIILDIGSYTVKAGYTGEESPRYIFPTVVGKSKIKGKFDTDYLVGDKAIEQKEHLILTYPVQYGIIADWNSYQIMLDYLFSLITQDLNCNQEDLSILIIDIASNTPQNRVQLAKILFDKYRFESLFMLNSARTSAFSSGISEGLFVDSGDQQTSIVPIDEEKVLEKYGLTVQLGGRDITDYLEKQIGTNGLRFTNPSERHIVIDIKERLCSVALDFDAELKKNGSMPYTKSDNTEITIRQEQCIKATEAIFNPSLVGKSFRGLAHLICQVIEPLDIPVKKELYKKIVVTGGNTLFQGYTERLEKEIQKLSPPQYKVKVWTLPERKYNVWVGGSIFVSSSTSANSFVERYEYEELGDQVFLKKFI